MVSGSQCSSISGAIPVAPADGDPKDPMLIGDKNMERFCCEVATDDDMDILLWFIILSAAAHSTIFVNENY